MKFLQYTSREASTAPHCYSSPTPCWLSPQYCTLLPMCWQDTQVMQACISCTCRDRWPKDDSLKLLNSAPVLAPSGIKPISLAWLWNTRRSMWSCTFRQGKRWHTQPDQQFPCHSSAPGHWPEPAGASAGRAGPTRATAAPSPWHLQSPLPTQRGHRCTGPCSAWAHLPPRTRATPQSHAPPGTPLHCRSPSQPCRSPHGGEHTSHSFQGPSECDSVLSTVHHPDALGLRSQHQLYLLFIILNLHISLNSLL